MVKYYFSLMFILMVFGCKTSVKPMETKDHQTILDNKTPTFIVNSRGDTIEKMILTDEEWKARLSENEYHILRDKGTERPGTGDLLHNKEIGFYACRGCGTLMFASSQKFESGCGWPSYFDVLDSTMIVKSTDYILGYPRTELTCAKCGGHLGHVFEDGPPPTGLRYCINSASLDFIKSEH